MAALWILHAQNVFNGDPRCFSRHTCPTRDGHQLGSPAQQECRLRDEAARFGEIFGPPRRTAWQRPGKNVPKWGLFPIGNI